MMIVVCVLAQLTITVISRIPTMAGRGPNRILA